MSILELKGGLLDLVSRLQDERSLSELLDHADQLVKTEHGSEDWWNELSTQQQDDLSLAVKQSENEAEWIDHAEAMKTVAKWRK